MPAPRALYKTQPKSERFFASLRMTTICLNAVILSGGEAGVEESLYISWIENGIIHAHSLFRKRSSRSMASERLAREEA